MNVVMIVVDTLRADHLGCYGYPRATSPNIDRLASRSVRFENCTTAWPETCQSMAAILSGAWCQTTGVVVRTPQAIPLELELLPEILDRRGYATAAFTTNSVLSKENRFDQGFDTYVEVSRPDSNPKKWSEVALAAEWIGQHAHEPFFLWVHHLEPHAPYAPQNARRFVGDRWYDPSRRVEVRPPERSFDALGGFPGFSAIRGHDELAYYIAAYDSEIVDVDAKIGELLATLDALELADDTIVIVVADHGEGFGEHDYYWHGKVPFEETAHVPLLLRVPGVAPGVSRDVVSTIDVAPTVLELLGLPRAQLHEGESLVTRLRDPEAPNDERVVFLEAGFEKHDRAWQRCVRDWRFKLVYMPGQRERDQLNLAEYQLYDLQDDPGETKDVLDRFPEVAERLRKELFAWMRDASLFATDDSPMTPEELDRIRAQGYGGE